MTDTEAEAVEVELDEDVAIEETRTKRDPNKKFKYEKLSVSMMKVWFLCKRKFHQHYIDRAPQPPQENFTLGTSVHYALEMANKSLQKDLRELNAMEIDSFKNLFLQIAAGSFVVDPILFSSGAIMVKDELSRPEVATEKIIGIEEEFNIVTPEGVRIYGFIDKIVEVNADTIRIIDYKTSKTPMSWAEAKNDQQLSMYDLAMSLKFPQYTNRELELRYLRTGVSVTVTKSVDDQYEFRQLLKNVDLQIKDYMKVVEETAAVAPEGGINEFCSWCPYKQNCKAYVDRVNTILPEAPATHDLTDASFLETWQRVNSIIKAAESWKDSLKFWAVERMNNDPETTITDGEKEIYSISATTKEYDVVKIGKMVPLDELLGSLTGESLVKINKKKFEDYLRIKGDRKLTQKADAACYVRIGAPQVRLKGAKSK